MKINFSSINISRLWTAFLVLADQAVNSGASFMTGIIISRMLSIGAFGEFSLGMTLLIFSLIFQDTLLASPYTYHLHNAGEERRPALRAGALIQSFLLAALCAAFLLIAAHVNFTGGEENGMRPVLTALACALPFLFARECLRRQFFAEFKLERALKMDIAVAALQLFPLLGLGFAGGLSSVMTFAIMAAAAATGVCCGWFFARREFDFRNVNVIADTRDNIRYGRWLLAGSACHLGSLYAYPWIIYLAFGKAEAGAFAACYSLINLINPFILGFNNYFRPKIITVQSLEGNAAMDKMTRRACLMLAPLALAVILPLVFAGGFLVRIIYGPAFAGLGTVIGVASLSLFPVVLGAPLQLAVLALNRPQINPMFHAAALAATIFVGTPLVFLFGKTGAAAGYALAATSGFAVLAWLYAREIKKREAIQEGM